jgi:ABC-type polysaccharide/polyol phosphate export permease
MQSNIGTVDRVLRIVVGIILIALVFVGPQTPWGWIGVVPLITALIGFCPAYRLFGLRTCPLQKRA